ncbi:DUF6894 family protein [Methylobacterium sp. Gmos1]
MPRFFFDTKADYFLDDDVGCDFPDAHAARDAAIALLPAMMQEQIGIGQSQEVSVLMRDQAGQDLFTASLTLAARWQVDTA